MRNATVRMLTFVALLLLVGINSASGQDIVVTSATPSSAEQGTVNLDVTIAGSGFKRGAVARFYLTGTTNPDGVRVNSTRYVNTGKLVANIDIAETATAAKFDVEVELAGRTGKGIEKFEVLLNGRSASCGVAAPIPGRFGLASRLHIASASGSAPYGSMFGSQMRAKKAQIGGVDVAVVAAGITESGTVEVFFVDAQTGQLLDNNLVGSVLQPHRSVVLTNYDPGATGVKMGDVNNDGLPDLVLNFRFQGIVGVFLGKLVGGTLDYEPQVTLHPLSTPTGGYSAMYFDVGNLDGIPGDEIAVTEDGSTKGKNFIPSKVHLFRFNIGAFENYRTIVGSMYPFAIGLAIGDLIGDPTPDLAVSMPGANFNGVRSAGLVYVYDGSTLTSPTVQVSPGIQDQKFGKDIAIGRIDGGSYADLVGTTVGDAVPVGAYLYSGPLELPFSPTFLPANPNMSGAYSNGLDVGDVNGDGRADVVIGAPNSPSPSGCSGAGVTYVYLSSSGTPLPVPSETYLLSVPEAVPSSASAAFGFRVQAVDGTSLIIISAKGVPVGNGSGQVYVYRVNP